MENSNEKGSIVFSRSLILVFLVSFAVSGLAQSSIITTYVGPPLQMNGAQAIPEAVDHPSSLAPDGAGGLYVASSSQNRVYRVAVDGTLTAIAGTSSNGFSGDGGLATSAQLNLPAGVAVDAAGNLYIADSGNHRVRKVTVNGVISTVAGNGTIGFSGDGRLATVAQLNRPSGVAIDAVGNLYIVDSGNFRVRKVTAGGVISTVAGDGTFAFSEDGGPATSAHLFLPSEVAVDIGGNLYIVESGYPRVRKVTSRGVITTVAGDATFGFSGDGGLATSAQLNRLAGVTVDTAGNLYIVDSGNSRVRKVTADGLISTVAGNGTVGFSGDGGLATSAQLNFPTGVAVDATGDLYIADTRNSRVRKVTADGVISTVDSIGTGFSGDGGAATSAQLNFPTGVAVDAAGNLYVADSGNYRVRQVTGDGVISTVAGIGTSGFSGDGGAATFAQLNGLTGVAVDAAGNLYIVDSGNSRVRKVTGDGVISSVAGNGTFGFSGDGGPATSAQLKFPTGIVVDAAGNLYVADSGNSRVRKVTAGGVISSVAGNGTFGFSGDGSSATAAQLNGPSGVAVDAAGNLYIADTNNYRVRKVTADGMISTVAGQDTTAEGYGPMAIAVDAGGNVYVASWPLASDSVSRVATDGMISTVAGNGTSGFSGDGGAATSAQLNFPRDVAVDAAGNLYIADTGNSRVRRVGNATNLPLVTDIQFDPFRVSVQSSWTATFSGMNLTDQTYFDLRFRAPGSNTDQVALNWQKGTAAAHTVLSGTDLGTWTITGVRAHQIETDHTGSFVPVAATITVSP